MVIVRMNKAMAQNHRFLLKNYINNTTPKFNIKPENGHFPKGSPFPGCHFQCTSTKMVDVHRFGFPMIDWIIENGWSGDFDAKINQAACRSSNMWSAAFLDSIRPLSFEAKRWRGKGQTWRIFRWLVVLTPDSQQFFRGRWDLFGISVRLGT